MGLILKGSQISALWLKAWFKSKTSIQEYRNEIQKSYWTCAWIIWYMFLMQCKELRIDHLPLLLCIDNALNLLVLVAGKLYWGLQVKSSFSIRGWGLKGCFERGIFWRAKSHLKGIEDFNLQHCIRCQASRLRSMFRFALPINGCAP
jgi:hypothetical protein